MNENRGEGVSGEESKKVGSYLSDARWKKKENLFMVDGFNQYLASFFFLEKIPLVWLVRYVRTPSMACPLGTYH